MVNDTSQRARAERHAILWSQEGREYLLFYCALVLLDDPTETNASRDAQFQALIDDGDYGLPPGPTH